MRLCFDVRVQRSNAISFIFAALFLLMLSNGMRFGHHGTTNFASAFTAALSGRSTKTNSFSSLSNVSNDKYLRFGVSNRLNSIGFHQSRRMIQTTSKLQQFKKNSQKYDTGITEDDDNELLAYTRPVIQWYPGHIAKAERLLQETFFKAVDVVVEVRDARILSATSHPNVPTWSIGKPRIVVVTHIDMISNTAHRGWKNSFLNEFEERKNLSELDKSNRGGIDPVCVLFVDAQKGAGIFALKREIMKTGEPVQERRIRKGLNLRKLRVGIIGYPNVGKSSLINRLLGGAKRAKAANTPGVTRALQWIKVKSSEDSNANAKNGEFELLDTPGVIPASITNQDDAFLLAASNCIGMASYDNQAVASFLCQYMLDMHRNYETTNKNFIQTHVPLWHEKCIDRYKFDPLQDKEETIVGSIEDYEDDDRIIERNGELLRILPRTGEDMLHDVAELTCKGNLEDASRKILQDYRTGRMGPICLQAPASWDGSNHKKLQQRNVDATENSENKYDAIQNEDDDNIFLNAPESAIETMKRRGLELPPQLKQVEESPPDDDDDKAVGGISKPSRSSKRRPVAGQGFFDGW